MEGLTAFRDSGISRNNQEASPCQSSMVSLRDRTGAQAVPCFARGIKLVATHGSSGGSNLRYPTPVARDTSSGRFCIAICFAAEATCSLESLKRVNKARRGKTVAPGINELGPSHDQVSMSNKISTRYEKSCKNTY